MNIYLRSLLFLSPATRTVKLGVDRRGRTIQKSASLPEARSPILSLTASLRWHVAGKSECSAKCGSGYRSLDVQCVKYSLLKRQSERVVSSVCANAIKPRSRESCHGDCLLKSWQYGAWSEVPLAAAARLRRSRLCLTSR